MQGSDQVGHSNVCKVVIKRDTLMCATLDQTGHFNVGPPISTFQLHGLLKLELSDCLLGRLVSVTVSGYPST